MKVVINDVEKLGIFSTIFQHLKGITEEINLEFTENGMYSQGLGSNHVCLVEFMIHSSWFSEYNIDKSCSLGINCEVFHSILSCLEKNNSFQMEYDNGDSLNITINCEKVQKEFEMRLLMIEENLLDIPKIEYTSDITILSKPFADYINELDIFGDDLVIRCDGNGGDNVVLEASGDNGKMRLIIDEDYMEEYLVEEGAELEVKYAMSYIKKMTSFVKLCDTMELHISENSPLKMIYKLSEDNSDNNYFSIYLAPKVEDD